MKKTLLSGMVIGGIAFTASGGQLIDGGDSGDVFASSTDNLAIYNSFFEVQWNDPDNVGFGYDGDGATFEDDEASGFIIYDSLSPATFLPPDELWTSVTLSTSTWDGREEFDGQTLNDIYSVEVSDNGTDFTPVDLVFEGSFPSGGSSGFTDTTGVADGFSAQYIKININARVEASGSAFNDAWSSRVTEIDLLSELPLLGGGLTGDYDDDGQVAQGDLNLVLNNWGSEAPFDPNGDAFSDSLVNQEELNRVLNNWGSSSAPSFSGSAVPEPASLIGLGVLGLAALRRRVA